MKEQSQKNKRHFKDWREKNPIQFWCSTTINQHKHKGFKVSFKPQELLPIAKQTKRCPICDVELDWSYGTKRHVQFNSPSLDRKTNQKILTLKNVWIICSKCNTTKHNRTLKEFIEYCKKIIENYELWNR